MCACAKHQKLKVTPHCSHWAYYHPHCDVRCKAAKACVYVPNISGQRSLLLQIFACAWDQRYVSVCQSLWKLTKFGFRLLKSRFFQTSAQMPPRGIYSKVTLLYLMKANKVVACAWDQGYISECVSLWNHCWLARISHTPISRTVWLKVPPCNSQSLHTYTSRTLHFFPFFLNLIIYLWLAKTSQQPISWTTCLKITPHCSHWISVVQTLPRIYSTTYYFFAGWA
jgi:hypothetical protein